MITLEAIKTYNLTKYYGKTLGIVDLNLEVPQGLLFGFLGANGAGKTTAIRVIMGLLKPTTGYAQVLGKEITRSTPYHPDLNEKLGFLPGELRLYEGMKGEEYLSYMASFYNNFHKNTQSLAIEALELSEGDLARSIGTYSRGMKQKIGIISAIQHDPDLIIMDEPTEGLDPLMQKHFYQLLLELNKKGKTIFMSSHNLAEVERICERVGVIRNGKLVAVEDVEDLKARRLYSVEVVFSNEGEAFNFQPPPGSSLEGEGRRFSFQWKGDFSKLFTHLSQYDLKDFSCQKATLEEIFLTYYGDGEEGV